MTKEDILDLMNREIITEVIDPEKLVGKSVEELKNMGIITNIGEVNIVERDEESTNEENDAPIVNDDTNTQDETGVEDENDAPVVDEELIEDEEEE